MKNIGMLEYVSCNYCNSNDYRKRYVKEGFQIVQCKKCGLIYVNPRLKEKSIHQLYDEDYFSGKGFDKSIDYKSEVEVKMKHADLLDWDLSAIKEMSSQINEGNPKILDVGCGMGLFLSKAKKKGFDAEGLELSHYASKFVSLLGIKIQNKSIEEADLKAGQYSAVVMREVVEHLNDPKKALTKIYSSIKNDGILFITTGNYNCIERRLKKSNWHYFMPKGHIYIFSSKTIKKYLEEVGFKRVIVTNQGDLLMNLLLKYKIIEVENFKPKNLLKRIVFRLVQFINHFISSGLRVYAIK